VAYDFRDRKRDEFVAAFAALLLLKPLRAGMGK